MKILNRFEALAIINYLDDALKHINATTPPGRLESDAAWNVRIAKKRLLDVLVADVEVEAIEVERAA